MNNTQDSPKVAGKGFIFSTTSFGDEQANFPDGCHAGVSVRDDGLTQLTCIDKGSRGILNRYYSLQDPTLEAVSKSVQEICASCPNRDRNRQDNPVKDS